MRPLLFYKLDNVGLLGYVPSISFREKNTEAFYQNGIYRFDNHLSLYHSIGTARVHFSFFCYVCERETEQILLSRAVPIRVQAGERAKVGRLKTDGYE